MPLHASRRVPVLVTCLLGASLAGSAIAAVPESAPFTLPSWWAVELPEAPPPPPRVIQPSPVVPSVDLQGDEPRRARAWPATARLPKAAAPKVASARKAAEKCHASASLVSGGMRTAS